MTDALLEKDLTKLFGLAEVDEVAQLAFIDEIGDVVLDTAFVRFIKVLDEERATALAHYVDTNPTTQMLLTHLFKNYADFERILEEAIVEVKEDAIDVLGE